MNGLFNIRVFGDNFLKKKSKDINIFDHKIKETIKKMVKTMYFYNGVGLAAPQVGLNLNLFIIDVGTIERKKRRAIEFINPQIVSKFGTFTVEEGCLSVPGVFAKIQRYKKIVVSAFKKNGYHFTFEADNLLSSAIQHEMDHLKGILFFEKLTKLNRIPLQRKIKNIKKNTKNGVNIREEKSYYE